MTTGTGRMPTAAMYRKKQEYRLNGNIIRHAKNKPDRYNELYTQVNGNG
jgi:hypothetical protein